MYSFQGHTYSIPESVMGLTFLAAGGCMPEAISSVLMIRKGMAINQKICLTLFVLERFFLN